MLTILSSNAQTPNELFRDAPREAREDNLQWLQRHMRAAQGESAVVLVGGTDPMAFRLRVAQSHARHDLMPSHWSHVMLLRDPARDFSSTLVVEISLDPPGGFGFPPPSNGLQTGELRRYRSAESYPNIAILAVPVAQAELMPALKSFQMQRTVLDTTELLLRWLAFTWGVARTPNPLLDGQGIPSAAMLEVVFGAAGFDLTPGLESRSSCPEAIWQAAKWWHEYYTRENRTGLRGAYCLGHLL
jgi:hypothetical protein